MKNQDAMEEIFNPKPSEIIIGEPDSQLLACGKNQNCELTFKGYTYLMFPCGLKIQKKNKIIDIATGREHTALLTEYGYVYVFGSTLHNKLGLDGTTVTNISSPKLLPLSQEIQLVQVACGDYHTLALTDKGEVWGFGGTLHKKIGNKSQKPSMISGLDKINIIKIGCGDFHSVALSDQGILFTWGGGGSKYNRGQLGHGILDDVQTPLPVKFFQNSPVYDFECGGYHTVSIQSDGEVFAWGNGQFGQLGNGGFEDFLQPKRVELPNDVVIIQVACGGHHSFYLSKEGKLYSCGKGTQGQTGQLKPINYPVPTLVQCLQYKYVEQISCGWNHSLALVNPNHVYSTGLNNYGQLGLGHQDNKMGFTWIDRLAGKNITSIKAGGDHSWFLIDLESPEVLDYRPPSPLYTPPEEPVEKNTSVKRQSAQNFLNKKGNSNFRERMSNKNQNIGPRSNLQNISNPNLNRMPLAQEDDMMQQINQRDNPIRSYNNYPDFDNNPNDNFGGDDNNQFDQPYQGNLNKKYPQQNPQNKLENYHGQISQNYKKQDQENPFVDEGIFEKENDSQSQSEIFSEEVIDPDIEQDNDDPDQNIFKNSMQEVQFERESQDNNTQINPNQNNYKFENGLAQNLNRRQNLKNQHLNPDPSQSLKSLENSSKKLPKNKSKGSFLKKQPENKIEKKPLREPRQKVDKRQTSNFLKQPSNKNSAYQNFPPQYQPLNQNYQSTPKAQKEEDVESQIENRPSVEDPYRNGHKNKIQPEIPGEYRSQPNQPTNYPKNFINEPLTEIDQNRKNFLINQIWKQSAYNMLLVNLELNHKFILLDFKPNKQNELLQAIHNSIEQISSQDPEIIRYDVIKYNDFVSKDSQGFLKRVMNQTVQIEQGMSDNIYIVMLVQQQNVFMSQYSYNIPDSNYEMLNFRESSLGPFYQFHPEEIERDKKWKLLSHAYEILLSNVFEYINLFTIYELRSTKYK